MDFKSLEGFEEFFVDGVINPAVASEEYRTSAKRYRKLTDRIFALYEPPEPEFDLVFLHGIGSDEFHCWSTPKGLLWPADFVPQDFPTARVLTVGYEHSLWNWKTLDKKEETAKLSAPSSEPPAQEGALSKAWDSFSDTVESSLSSWWNKSTDEGKPSGKKDNTITRSTKSRAPKDSNPPANALTEKHAAKAMKAESESTSLLELLMSATNSSPTAEMLLSPAASTTQSSESLQRVAADVASRLLSAEVGVGKRPVVFVVHSMGGLVTKRMLVSLYQVIANAPPPLPDRLPEPIASLVAESDDTLKRTATPEAYRECLANASTLLSTVRGVVFYCTPHFGSGLASVITGLQRYYQSIGGLTPTHVVTGLGDHNKGELKQLNTQFLDLIERLQECRGGDDLLTKYHHGKTEVERDLIDTNPPGFTLLSFGETRKLKNLVRVVEPDSANPAPDDPRFPFYLVDGDHGSVNRPDTKTSPAYSMLYGFLDRMQQRGRLRLDTVQSTPLAAQPQQLTGETLESTLGNTRTHEASDSARDHLDHTREIDLDDVWEQCFSDPNARGTSPPLVTTVSHRDHTEPSSSTLWSSESGRNEAALSARVLQSESTRLRLALSRFFGRAMPPEVDGLLHLSADILTLFRRLQEGLVHASPITTNSGGTISRAEVQDAVLESFNTPLLLAIHWTRWTIQMIQRFELQQKERSLTALETMPGWEAMTTGSVVPHLYTAEVEEIQLIQKQVSVFQGEWEGFRRYIILHVRSLLVGKNDSSDASTTRAMSQGANAFELLSSQGLTTLFFSKAARSAMSQHMHDGGFFSSLLSHYMDSVVTLGISPLCLAHPTTMTGVRGVNVLDRLVEERDYALSLLLESMASTSSSLLKPANADDVKASTAAQRLSTLALTQEQLKTVATPLLAISSFLAGCLAGTFRRDLWGNNCDTSAASCLSQALGEFTACQRALEKHYRFSREAAIRQRGSTVKGNQDSWWSNKVGGGAGASQIHESVDELDKAFKSFTVLAAAMELGVHVLLALEHLDEMQESRQTCLLATSTGRSPTLTAALALLTQEVSAAQRSYESLERATHKDAAATAQLSKPFTKASNAKTSATQAEARHTSQSSDSVQLGTEEAAKKKPEPEMDILETAKATFKEAMSKLLKEMEESDSNKKANPSDARPGAVASSTDVSTEDSSTTPKKLDAVSRTTSDSVSAPSGDGRLRSLLTWPPKPASGSAVVTLLIDSVIGAWETVRRGEDKPLTPVFFAHSMMVAWWSVEERVLTVGTRYQASELLACVAQRRKSPKTPSAVLASLTAAAVGGGAAQTPQEPATAAVTVLPGHADATLQLLQNVHRTVSSDWLALRGFRVEQTTLKASFDEQQRRLKPYVGPCEDVQADERGSLSTTAPIPPLSPFVIRASQLDAANALSQCLHGNRFFLRLRTSPDAAHAYLAVLRQERVASSALYRHAAVGLAWIHLHRVTAAAMEIAGAQNTRDLPVWPRQGDSLPTSASLQMMLGKQRSQLDGPCQVGVVDSLSAYAAPVHFLPFYKSGWQAAAMSEQQSRRSGLEYLGHLYQHRDGATSNQVAHARAVGAEVFGHSRAEVAAAHQAAQSAMVEHLTLSQHYFNEVLLTDPTNVGALCGAGRLCSLVLPNVGGSEIRLPLPSSQSVMGSSPALSSSLLSVGARCTTLREATQYFCAAVGNPDERAKRGGDEVFADVNNTFRSYAANWLGDYCRPEATDFLAYSPVFGTGDAAGGAAIRADQMTRERFIASCEEAELWYQRATRYAGLNDWALCNLGLMKLQTTTDHRAVTQGVGLLEKALELNPANQWALWGLGRHSPQPARQQACRATLRRLLTMTYRATVL